MKDIEKKIRDNFDDLEVGEDNRLSGYVVHPEPWRTVCFVDERPCIDRALEKSEKIMEEEDWDGFVYLRPGEKGINEPYGMSVFYKKTRKGRIQDKIRREHNEEFKRVEDWLRKAGEIGNPIARKLEKRNINKKGIIVILNQNIIDSMLDISKGTLDEERGGYLEGKTFAPEILRGMLDKDWMKRQLDNIDRIYVINDLVECENTSDRPKSSYMPSRNCNIMRSISSTKFHTHPEDTPPSEVDLLNMNKINIIISNEEKRKSGSIQGFIQVYSKNPSVVGVDPTRKVDAISTLLEESRIGGNVFIGKDWNSMYKDIPKSSVVYYGNSNTKFILGE